MSRLASETPAQELRQPTHEWRGYPGHLMHDGYRRSSSGFLVAGLVAIGVGALAWHYLGPDLRRYLKIRSM